ncbi:MAG: hypothetical protein AB4041_13535, partial [Microcystaceae cyanobacterium]
MKTIMEERFELYYQLINQLLECPQEQEIELLQANSEFIDLGLLIAMNQAANYYAQNNNQNIAQYLQNMSAQLVQVMGFNSLEEMYQDYSNCLIEILLTVEQNPSPESVYPVFTKYLEQLNLNLCIILQRWTDIAFPTLTTDQARSVAGMINN